MERESFSLTLLNIQTRASEAQVLIWGLNREREDVADLGVPPRSWGCSLADLRSL